MNKNEIYEFIKSKNIWYQVYEHKAVYNMEELDSLDLPYKDRDAKNLFLRDDKKKNYYLVTLKGDKKVDLKEFRKNNNLRNLSFASTSDLNDILNLMPGSVSPLGLLNDNELKVILYIDSELLLNDGIIGVHPCDNTATIFLYVNDLINIIKEHGNEVIIQKI